MKKTVEKEVTICDFCEKDGAFYSCLKCGKDICYECRKIQAVEYSHAVYFQGSGDGLYCIECDSILRIDGDPLHRAYQVIQSLRNERNGFYADFQKRQEAAEAHLKSLQQK